MKILIAEDEPMLRAMIKRVAGHSAAKVLEADNGLDALMLIEREDPDLLITDLQMPLLDGFDVIAALRDSETHRRMPVICLTVLNGLADVGRVSDLGISDYLLKPIKPIELTERIRRVLRWEGNWRNDRDRSSDEMERMLVIDPDPNFRAFVRPLLDSDYEVVEAATAAEGLAVFKRMPVKPGRILISDAAQLLNASRVAELFSRLSINDGDPVPSIYLLSDHDTAPVPPLFNGIVRRTFVPQRFVASLRQSLPGLRTAAARIRAMLADESRPWLLSAVRQTFGVLFGQDVNVFTPEVAGPSPVGVMASIDLSIEGSGCRLNAHVGCMPEHAVRVASALLGRQVTLEDGGADILSESANTIGGRIKATLIEQGFTLKLGLPAVSIAPVEVASTTWDASTWVRTSGDERFFVAVSLNEDENVTSVPTASRNAIAAAAAASADDELDSVLF